MDTALVVVEFGSGDVGAFHVSWGLPEGTAGMSQQVVYAPSALLQIDPFSKIRIAPAGVAQDRCSPTSHSEPVRVQVLCRTPTCARWHALRIPERGKRGEGASHH